MSLDRSRIQFSSREKGTSSDFVGWTIETAPDPVFCRIDYADKQKKFPTLDLVRYPRRFFSYPTSNYYRLRDGMFERDLVQCHRPTDVDKATRFLQSTEFIYKQIAQREHRLEILEKGISAFLKYKTRKVPKELYKRLRETAAVVCNTTRMETEHSQESTKAKFAFSNRSGQECAFNSAAVFFVLLREIGLPLNAENNLMALFNLFTALHRGKALTTEEKSHLLSTDIICDDKFSGPNIITSFMTNFSRSSSAKDTQLWFRTKFTSETTCNCGTKQIKRELVVFISLIQDQRLNLNGEAIESAFI